MAFTLSLCTKNLTLSVGDCEENIRIGPLEVYLKRNLLAVSWRGRFELLSEQGLGSLKLDGHLFKALESTGERRRWFLLGRFIYLNTGSVVA